MSQVFQGPTRSVGQLYRDCLRLVNHIAGKSSKGANLKKIVVSEFRRNAGLKEQDQIDATKGNAMRALSNYLMLQSLSKDKNFKDKASSYNQRELQTAEQEKAKEDKMEQEYAAALARQKQEGQVQGKA